MKETTDFEAAKPFIKWAGGKGQLLSQLDKYLPRRLFNEDFTYIEPFVGGGAMLFHMLRIFPNLTKVVINDINENLIKAYLTIKDRPQALIHILQTIENEYLSIPLEDDRKSMFLDIREKYNAHKVDDVLNSVYFIFLNRTCFNGLYRVNGKGDFNVPFGKYKNPQICNPSVIIADSAALNSRNIIIMNDDYSKTTEHLRDGLNFFYFDPPYRPLSATSSFTSYTKTDFNDGDQTKLADFCKKIDSEKCLWMLSNSDCSAKDPSDRFFETIYNGYSINRVYASRSINANPAKRGKLTELLIHNNYNIN